MKYEYNDSLINDNHANTSLYHHFYTTVIKVQEFPKAVPLQAWTGPGGSRKLRFPDFVTTA